MQYRLIRPLLSSSLAVLLSVTALGPSAAQDASADSVGQGGRAAPAGAGYALTIPDDWVYVLLSGADSQALIEEVGSVLPEISGTVESVLASGSGISLLAFGPGASASGGMENCNVIDTPTFGQTIDENLEASMAQLDEYSDLLASGPEVISLALPAGSALRIEFSLALSELEALTYTSYVFADDSTFHTLTCTDATPPDDRWLSIAETFELLPAAD